MVTVDESRYDESPARRPQNILDVASLVCRSVAAQGMRRAEYTHVGQVRQTGKEGQVHLLTRIMLRKARVISIPEIASEPSA